MEPAFPIKIYLDSNVIMKYILEEDKNVERILNESKRGKLKLYMSRLSFQEIATSASIVQSINLSTERINRILNEFNINIFNDYDITLISGVVTLITENINYSDILHIKIAEKIGASYFITYDSDILRHEKINEMTIFEPTAFIKKYWDD